MKSFSSQNLIKELQKLVSEERKITTLILQYLYEVEARLLFAELGYSSLHEFCVKHLGYCEGSAHIRISSMRLLKTLPETEKEKVNHKLESGVLTLSNLSMVQNHIKGKEKVTGEKSSPHAKIELLAQVESKTKREAEKILFESYPEIAPIEKVKPVSMNQTQITFTVPDRFLEKLKRVKEVRAHVNVRETHSELFESLLEFYLKHKDPVQKAERNLSKISGVILATKKVTERNQKASNMILATEKKVEMSPVNSASAQLNRTEKSPLASKTLKCPTKKFQKTFPERSEVKNRSRFTPSAVKHTVTIRDRCCTYIDPKTQQACKSRYGLELDHIQPFALGGESTVQNLRLRCRAHNSLHALNTYGKVFRETTRRAG